MKSWPLPTLPICTSSLILKAMPTYFKMKVLGLLPRCAIEFVHLHQFLLQVFEITFVTLQFSFQLSNLCLELKLFVMIPLLL